MRVSLNDQMHKVDFTFTWRDIFADELGETKLKMHEILKKKFNVESTKDLNVMEFVDFLCEIDMLADEHSMKLPYGNDYEIAVYGKIE